jgi:hypothetical protein
MKRVCHFVDEAGVSNSMKRMKRMKRVNKCKPVHPNRLIGNGIMAGFLQFPQHADSTAAAIIALSGFGFPHRSTYPL